MNHVVHTQFDYSDDEAETMLPTPVPELDRTHLLGLQGLCVQEIGQQYKQNIKKSRKLQNKFI